MKNKNKFIPILIAICLLLFFKVNSQVVINEIQVKPGGNQGLIVFNGNSGNEYIELYNPSCSPVDVSGYFFACGQDFAGMLSGGAFRIPNVAAAIIAPGSHLVLGTSTSSADPNSIDIKLPDYTSNYCLNNSSYNFILANIDGWVALYDAQGTPIDGLYWSSAAGNISQTGDYGVVPCVPSGSPGGVVLESAQQINSGFPGVLSYGGANPSTNNTFSRIPDGASWQANIAPSINDLTVGNCNGGTCNTITGFSWSFNITEPSCGNSNGSIQITCSGSSNTPYDFSYDNGATWPGSDNSSITFVSLSANSYNISVKDQSGCRKDTTITLVSSGGTSISFTKTDVSCFSGSDGTATAIPSGGTSPYTYLWNDPAPQQTTQTATALAAGTYIVTITDANSCTATANVTISQPSSAVTISNIISSDATCGASDGDATVTANGGTSPYTYLWTGGQTVNPAVNLTAGTYTVTVTDSKNCSITSSVTVSSSSGLTVSITQTDVSCFGGSDGTATATPSGGTSPYTYLWSNDSTTSNIQLLNSIAYTVTVTDANSCTATVNVTISQPSSAVTISNITSSDATCGASDGTATVTANGGTSPYTYLWTGGQSVNPAINLTAGTYTVTVTDSKNCTITSSVTVSSSSGLTVSIAQTNVSCFGGSDGTATATPSGGTSPYTYLWSNDSTTSNIQLLNSNAYTVTVIDANSCTATANVTITQPSSELISNISSQTNPTCGNSDGSITVNASGGTTDYQYSNDNGSTYQVGNIFINLAVGIYTIIVKDINECTATTSATLINTVPTVSPSQTDVSCYGDNNGTATVLASGGTIPYTYSWSNGSTTSNIQLLTSNVYSVTVTDANLCQAITSVTITQPASALSNNITFTNVSCFEGTNGTATAVATGGTIPYTYSWSNGSTTSGIQLLTSNVYTITVTDNNNCTATDSVTITQPSSALTISITSTDATCGASDGTATVTATGGITPYTYQWSNSTIQQSNNNLATGTYSVTVTDNNGCTNSDSVLVNTDSPILTLTPNPPSCIDKADGSIQLAVAGGTSPFTFIWNTDSTSEELSNLIAGNYAVTVTDVNNCTVTGSADVLPSTVLCYPAHIYIPNVFSPNDDGQNDILYVRGYGIKSLSFRIFDRWGEKIFETKDQSIGWDGNYNGKKLFSAVFVYYIQGIYQDGNEFNEKGNITLVK